MTPQELTIECAKAINECAGTGIEPKIALKIPESKRCSHNRYPWGKTGPKGMAVQFGLDGYDTVIFDAIDLLAFLIANDVVDCEVRNGI